MKAQGESMTCQPAPHHRHGFTLLELMISIALVLILILGVNTVFSLTSQTVAAGNALGTIHRANAAVNGTIYQDFKSMVIGNDMPCLVILNQRRTAFRNAADRESDKDGFADTLDLNGDGVEDPAERVAIGTYNHRNHRIDKLCFFARGKYFRQTGTGSRFWDGDSASATIPTSSNEAWIKYGFLSLPNNKPNPDPSTDYRPPADTDPTPAAPGDPPSNTPQGNPNNYYATQWILGRQVTLLVDKSAPGMYQASSASSLQPLDPVSPAVSETNELIQQNRYDVALTTIKDYRDRVAGIAGGTTDTTKQYWRRLPEYYFRGHPFVNRPLDNVSAARALPVFLPACTQFIVEYAGDFFSQNPANGAITGTKPDGFTDFQVDAAGVRKTRWYGFQRDINGDGRIDKDIDVVPAADVFTTRQIQPWETFPDANRYIVHWGADNVTVNLPRPQMLRITLTIDDPQSALGGGETFEYVGNLQ
jgi:prepilin-type N-terminal cleavage/methylation domain-containing protein